MLPNYRENPKDKKSGQVCPNKTFVSSPFPRFLAIDFLICDAMFAACFMSKVFLDIHVKAGAIGWSPSNH